ncbi:uncharacterized protein [Miscanthus floridulus]|uniref:uncharacterized protein isoform X2 n=1 Tax=Miscanthus floridulus TaxID=154761 RepID=UPI00345844A6
MADSQPRLVRQRLGDEPHLRNVVVPNAGARTSGAHGEGSSTSPSALGMAVSQPRLVRRRLDMPRPGSFIATESRRRRVSVTASGAEKENSAPLLCNGHRRCKG